MNAPALQILFIDQEPSLYHQVSRLLHASGEAFNLRPLLSPEELAAVLDDGSADALLCVLRPPPPFAGDQEGPAGLEILHHVQQHRCSLPVILLCAAGDESYYASRAIWQGAADYVLIEAMQRLPLALKSAIHHHQLLNRHPMSGNVLQLALAVLRSSHEAICITDAKLEILLVNEAFTRVTGYSLEDTRGRTPGLLKSGRQSPEFYAALWQSLKQNGHWQGEIINRHKNGSLYTEWLHISAVSDGQGEVSHYIGQFGYVAEQRRLVERINHLSQYDPLTGLPNRSLFLDRMDQFLVSTRRNQRNAAIVLLNLDRFRLINDSLGQSAGDRILIEMAQRFSAQIRQGDTVARMSGNEFCFLLSELKDDKDAFLLARRLQDVIAQPVQLDGKPVTLSASIGISLLPKDGEDGEALLQAADAALVRAKLEGGNNLSFYASGMDANARRRQEIERHLRDALARDELSVVYQAQNNLHTGNLIGAEALLRWHSEALGLVSPAEFIPVAEETGLIIPIGQWVLRQACLQNKAWLDQGLGQLRIAVNLSARQLRHERLIEEVRAALAESALPPELLELEVTESGLIHNIDAAVATCRQLKALGLKLSLDDFGTGYSSLAYVARFPFDKLKIDQGFVRDITHNPANAAIASAAIAIAHALNLSVLAEGVETEAQALFLRNRHCDAMQGYLFSRPQAPEQFAQLLAERPRLLYSLNASENEPGLLLVDDEPSILRALSRLFRHEHYRVHTAATAAEAFEVLARSPIQVIISDQRMAGMTGTEFFTRVRQLYPHTLRIILSGYTELAAVMDAVNHGAVYKFLTKPWEDDQLRDQVREAFRRASQNAAQDTPP